MSPGEKRPVCSFPSSDTKKNPAVCSYFPAISSRVHVSCQCHSWPDKVDRPRDLRTYFGALVVRLVTLAKEGVALKV